VACVLLLSSCRHCIIMSLWSCSLSCSSSCLSSLHWRFGKSHVRSYGLFDPCYLDNQQLVFSSTSPPAPVACSLWASPSTCCITKVSCSFWLLGLQVAVSLLNHAVKCSLTAFWMSSAHMQTRRPLCTCKVRSSATRQWCRVGTGLHMYGGLVCHATTTIQHRF
jgi:hypothetical protein